MILLKRQFQQIVKIGIGSQPKPGQRKEEKVFNTCLALFQDFSSNFSLNEANFMTTVLFVMELDDTARCFYPTILRIRETHQPSTSKRLKNNSSTKITWQIIAKKKAPKNK